MDRISLCICTYKRPDCIRRLLKELENQQTDWLFSFDIIVVDNDKEMSAKETVLEFSKKSTVETKYFVEQRQGIAMARNKAVASANGDFIAFIDDDEIPNPDWLITLYRAQLRYPVDGVLGPVLPRFEEEPPKWIIKGGFYNRRRYPTGYRIDGQKGRTGNLLFKRKIIEGVDPVFQPQFITDEDQDFFTRMIEKGHSFIWCDEAIAYEIEPPIRWKRSFLLRRALLRGKMSIRHPGYRHTQTVKSLVAFPIYMIMIPFLGVFCHSFIMKYLEKACHHLGRLLAVLGFTVVEDKYVTE